MALACAPPEDSERPISHWTLRELAAEAIKRGMGAAISERHVGRFSNQVDRTPHRSRSWLKSEPDEAAEENMADVTTLSLEAQAWLAAGERVLSTDEMTGIQALERTHPTIPMGPGRVARREFEYIQRGTLPLIANVDVAQGTIVGPSLVPTRTAEDF